MKLACRISQLYMCLCPSNTAPILASKKHFSVRPLVRTVLTAFSASPFEAWDPRGMKTLWVESPSRLLQLSTAFTTCLIGASGSH